MAVRPVLVLPERVLKSRSRELSGDPGSDLVADLIDTMRSSPACVGLAAPQIGVARRAIVVDVTGRPKTTVVTAWSSCSTPWYWPPRAPRRAGRDA